ncbi:MAG TPA: amino acid-binding protein, partial [Burkholderiaceae bacterium]
RGYAFSVVLHMAQQNSRAVVREYQQLHSASHDPDLSARSIEGFIAAKALVKVMEGINTPLTSSSVASALEVARSVDVGDYVLDFGLRGQTASRYVGFAVFGAGGKLLQ